jgi:hypothetical protein
MSWPPYLQDTPCFWTDGTSLLYSALPFKMLHLRAKLRTYMYHIHEWHQNLEHQKYCKQKLVISLWILGWGSHFTGTARHCPALPLPSPTRFLDGHLRIDQHEELLQIIESTEGRQQVQPWQVSAAWYVGLSQQMRGSPQSENHVLLW